MVFSCAFALQKKCYLKRGHKTQNKKTAVSLSFTAGVGSVDKKDTRAHLAKQTETHRQRLRFREKGQGIGRMASFLPRA